MAKKTRRPRRRAPVTQVAPAQTAQIKNEPAATVTRATMVTKAPVTTKVDLAQEYHYVFADLRKIAIIAVMMFVLLFFLAFVLK